MTEASMQVIQLVSTLVGTIGFPIIACGALFWKINEQDKQHKAETDALAKTIQANTSAITELTIHLKSKGE